jgi:sialate O-acetylesterase
MRSIILLSLFLSVSASADVRLPKVLNSHMVLQRDTEVTIWGWADPGETVTVVGSWLPVKTAPATKADADGKWALRLKTGPAGGPHTLTVTGKNTIKLDDILFGEVWIGSGQSNMEMPLARYSGAYTGIKDAQAEIAAANYPQIRLFKVGNFSSKEPLDDVEPGIVMYGIPTSDCLWHPCTAKTVPAFASTAYFFARELHKQLDVPIGIIDSCWGGTSAETWTPAWALKKLEYPEALAQAAKKPQDPKAKVATRLYNGMIHPLRSMRIRGVIWYQGEGNTARHPRYRDLFSTMITSWREVFAQPFPFYYAQISPFNYRGGTNSAYLREAQLQTLSVPDTGMAVTMDIGDLRDIHPKNKQEVGRRLALCALARDYGKDVIFSGPAYRDFAIEGGRVRLSFDHADGLATRDGKAPSHFEIAGDDKAFHPATAVIEGGHIIVSSDKVVAPKAVRYAFSNAAVPNLMNKAKLPASSFRTDKW